MSKKVRIICASGKVDEAVILTADGRNLLDELNVFGVTIKMAPGGPVTALLEVHADIDVRAELDERAPE